MHVKNLNHLHTELSLGYLKDAKFYLESKTSLIDISSIASFKLFLIAWLQEYCTFSDSSVVSLKSLPFFSSFRKNCVHYQTFFSSSNMFSIR